MKKKPDEENFDEALAQAYRSWTATTLPSSLTTLFDSVPDPLPEGTSFMGRDLSLRQLAHA